MDSPLDLGAFDFPVRVYYEDTDAGGVVYHSNYLNFMERARTEWLRTLGFEQDTLAKQEGVLFVVRSASIEYLRSARFNQQLIVRTTVSESGKASFTFLQKIYNSNDEGEFLELLTEGQIKVVCVDSERFRPKATPPSIREALFGGS